MNPKLPDEGWRECQSCGGVYNVLQRGGYYHKCPSGTPDPRDENLVILEDRNTHPKAIGKGFKVIPKPEPEPEPVIP